MYTVLQFIFCHLAGQWTVYFQYGAILHRNLDIRSMNQDKLQVVKQEMSRVNVNILGISKLEWTGMGEFNSDDCFIYYCGQESLRRNGVAIIVNKSLKCSTWM